MLTFELNYLDHCLSLNINISVLVKSILNNDFTKFLHKEKQKHTGINYAKNEVFH